MIAYRATYVTTHYPPLLTAMFTAVEEGVADADEMR
jgi:hypothetical protein